MNYANVWKRFVASLIDGIVLYILQALVGFVLGLVIGGAAGEDGAGAAVLVASVAGIVIGWLYYAIQESSPKQSTIGKQAMGLVVTDMNGERVSFVKASIRHFAKFLSAIILMIGYIMAFFTEKKQGLHDMIAGTLVLQK
jgi:uncharacterized RDD family membrane protein YckC